GCRTSPAERNTARLSERSAVCPSFAAVGAAAYRVAVSSRHRSRRAIETKGGDMKTRYPLLTLALGLALAVPSAAQARLLMSERSLPTRTPAASRTSAAALKAAGIRFQAAKNAREERLLGSGGGSQGG